MQHDKWLSMKTGTGTAVYGCNNISTFRFHIESPGYFDGSLPPSFLERFHLKNYQKLVKRPNSQPGNHCRGTIEVSYTSRGVHEAGERDKIVELGSRYGTMNVNVRNSYNFYKPSLSFIPKCPFLPNLLCSTPNN